MLVFCLLMMHLPVGYARVMRVLFLYQGAKLIKIIEKMI